MSWEDFLAQFTNLGICSNLPLSWHAQSVAGRWVAGASAGGPKAAATFKYNPQYLLRPSATTTSVWVGIEQVRQSTSATKARAVGGH
jgi:hypothetical protein